MASPSDVTEGPSLFLQYKAGRKSKRLESAETSSDVPVHSRPPANSEERTCLKRQDGSVATEDLERGSKVTLNAVTSSDITLFRHLKASPRLVACMRFMIGTYSEACFWRGTLTRHLLEEDLRGYRENHWECGPSVEHPVALILGTGLGHLALRFGKAVRRIDYRDIPGFLLTLPPMAGHSFEALLVLSMVLPVVVYPGRVPLSDYLQLR